MTGAVARPEPEPSLFGSTARERWTFSLCAFVVLIFSEAWIKSFLGAGEQPADSALIRALYYPAYAAGLTLMAMSPAEMLAMMGRTALVWVLVAFAFVSTLWSIDPAATDRRAVALLFSTICAAAIGANLSWRQLTRMFAFCFALASVASLLCALLLPKFGVMQTDFPGAWSGLFIEKNGLGAWAAQTLVACGAAFLLDRPRRWWWAAAAVLGATLLLLSTSKTALVVALIGCLSFAFAWAVRRGAVAAVVTTFVAVVALGAMAFAVAFAPDTLLGLLGKDPTLTGRTRIWAAVSRQIALRPRTGFGYGAIWSDQTGWGPVYWVVKQYGARPAYAHNGWLDLWLALGVYAVAIMAVLLVVTWVSAIAATYRRSDAYLALPVISMFTVANLTESSIVFYNDIGWVLFIIVAAKLMTPDRAPAPTRRPDAARAPTAPPIEAVLTGRA